MIKVCKVSDDAKVLYCTINKNKLDYKVIDGFCKKHDLKYVIGYDWLKKEKHCTLRDSDGNEYYYILWDNDGGRKH